MKSDNKYLKDIAENTGSNVTGKLKSNNAYLHMIADNTKYGGAGGTVDLSEIEDAIDALENAVSVLENAGYITSIPTISITKQSVADTGMASTYQLTSNGVPIGDKINIPLDEFLEDAHVRVVSVADTPVQGYNVGDIYIDLEMKIGRETKHLYLLANDFMSQSTFDMVVEYSNGSTKTFRIIGEEIVTQ